MMGISETAADTAMLFSIKQKKATKERLFPSLLSCASTQYSIPEGNN